MDILQTLMPFVTGGGIPVILFIIWYFTFTRSNTQYDAAIKLMNESFLKANEDAIQKAKESALEAIRMNKETSEESRRLFELALLESRNRSNDSIKHSNELFRESASRTEKLLAELVQVQKEEAKAKELLVGLLSSMKTTLEAK